MRKIFFLLLLICTINAHISYATDIINTQFTSGEGWINKNYGDWTQTIDNGETWEGYSVNMLSSKKRINGYAIGFNDVGDWFELPPVDNPGVLTFYSRLHAVGTASNNKLKIQRWNGDWVDIAEIEHSTTSYVKHTININIAGTVRLRICRSADETTHYIDDLVLTDFNSNDNTSKAEVPDAQIGAKLISSTADTDAEAVDVFKFKITDLGSGDTKATKVTKISIFPGSANNSDWTDNIQAVKLNDGGDISIASTNITDSKIDITINSGDLDISDASNKEITLSIYLNTSNISDGKILQFEIDADAHSWESDASGSSFSSDFGTNITSNNITIDVTASKLNFSGVPASTNVNTNFSLTVSASDANGNTDIGATNSITLTNSTGSGTLSSVTGLTQNLVAGTYTWNDLQNNKIETFKISAQAGGFTSILTSDIAISGNSTSKSLAPTTQITATNIDALNDTKAEAIEVFKFKISDLGGDGVDTKVLLIKIKNANPANDADWTNNIGGVKLNDGSSDISTGSVTINDDYISIPISANALNILDNTTKEITLSVYLKTTGKVEDEKVLKFIIDEDNHEWTTRNGGSTFAASFGTDIVSNEFTIAVTGTKLEFSSVPDDANVNTNFKAKISLVDENSNADNTSTTVTLSLVSGAGTLSSATGLSQSVNGNFTWNDLQNNKAENFRVQAQASGFETALTDNISTVDRDSKVENPTSQIAVANISSLKNSSSNTIDVFKFKISDLGTNDNLDTEIKKIVIKNAYPSNGASWVKNIKGIKLNDGTIDITTGTPTISDSEISFSISTGNLDIANSSNKEFTLSVYLRKTNIEDGQKLQFMIDANNHDWTEYYTGSELNNNFASDITSNIFTIDVSATKLHYTFIPASISAISTSFTVKVAATDANTNIDIDATNAVSLQKSTGSGILSSASGLSGKSLVAGVFQWADIQYDNESDFEIQISDDASGLSSTNESIMFATSTTLLNDDFEDADLTSPAWINTTDWKVMTYKPIDGSYSLMHNLSNATATSYISYDLSAYDMSIGKTIWKFDLKNGDFDPSSTNKFWFYLAASESNLNSSTVDGYAVGVNMTGSSDILTLWKVVDGQVSESLISTEFDWGKDNTVSIEVIRNPTGKWELKYDSYANYDNFYLAGTSTNTDITSAAFCGLVFDVQTASNAGKLWFDNVSIKSINTPPALISVNVVSATQVELNFSENLEKISAETIGNYTIKDSKDNNITISSASLSDSKVTLTVSELYSENYTITLANIKDTDDKTISNASSNFTYMAQNSIVINEIMADPSPSVGLPEYEYIELYNNTDNDISLENWSIQIGTTKKTFPVSTIKSKKYLLLVPSSSGTAFDSYVDVVKILGTTDLSNSGKEIILYNNKSTEITRTEYSDEWYQDENKDDGGWSLERIDHENFCGTLNNWKAAIDSKGGTPAGLNSVYTPNPDNISPDVSRLELISSNKLAVVYTKEIDANYVLDINNYTVDNGIEKPYEVSISDTSKKTVILQFTNQLSDGSTYNISISNMQDYCKNAMSNKTISFTYKLIFPESVNIISKSIVQIIFSEHIEITSSETLSNYTVNNSIGNPTTAVRDPSNTKIVQLTFDNTFVNGQEYTISISGVKDNNGNTMSNADLSFTYYEAKASDLIINEVLFNPYSEGVDFVEIYNNSTFDIDLKNIKLASKDEEDNSLKSIKTISETSLIIKSNEYMVLTTSKEKTLLEYTTTNEDGFIELASMPSFADDKGIVVLLGVDNIIIDELSYDDDMHFKLLSNDEGISLERIRFDKPTSEKTNWHSASADVGYATPAYKNSQYNDTEVSVEDDIKLESETFSPDNDGYNDLLTLHYKFDEAGYVANVTIYNSEGKLVRHIASNKSLSDNGLLTWDGLDEGGAKAKIGIHVIHFEIFNLDGSVKKFKKTCVLATKL